MTRQPVLGADEMQTYLDEITGEFFAVIEFVFGVS